MALDPLAGGAMSVSSTTAISPKPGAARVRLQSLDTLKAVAVFAVIILHSRERGPGYWKIIDQLCRFAVPSFFILGGYFFMRAWRRDPLGHARLARIYAVRLLKPILFWGLFYAVVPPYFGGPTPEHAPGALNRLAWIFREPGAFLLTGFAYHLWFLSAMLSGMAVLWICLRTGGLWMALFVGALLYGIALVGGAYTEMPFGLHSHWDVKNGPLVSTLFLALGAWLETRGEARPGWPMAAALALGGMAVHLGEGFFLHHQVARSITSNEFLVGTIPFALGMVLLALARPDLRFVGHRVGLLSLGIYALHPYLIEHLRGLGRLANYPLALATAALLLSFLLVLLLSKIPALRPVVM